MKQIAVDTCSLMKKLSTEALTLQIGPTESPLASFLLVLSLRNGFAYNHVTSAIGQSSWRVTF